MRFYKRYLQRAPNAPNKADVEQKISELEFDDKARTRGDRRLPRRRRPPAATAAPAARRRHRAAARRRAAAAARGRRRAAASSGAGHRRSHRAHAGDAPAGDAATARARGVERAQRPHDRASSH